MTMDEEFEELTILLPHMERETLYEIYIYLQKDINKILDTFLTEVKEEQPVSICTKHCDNLLLKDEVINSSAIATNADFHYSTSTATENDKEEREKREVEKKDDDENDNDCRSYNKEVMKGKRSISHDTIFDTTPTAPKFTEDDDAHDAECMFLEHNNYTDRICLHNQDTQILQTEDNQIVNDEQIARLISEDEVQIEDENEIAEQILSDGVIADSIVKENENEIMNFVLSCTPENVDLDYIYERCTEIGNNTSQLQQFIKELIEGDISHYEQYLQRNEIITKQQNSLNKITLSNFVEIFPKPMEYFIKIKEPSNDEKLHAVGYLQRRYRLVDDVDLKNVFESNNYNLTVTCQELDSWGTPTRDWRHNSECFILPHVNMDFIYEIYFIENKRKILEYIQLESHKQAVYDRAKMKEPKLECVICCDDELQIENMAGCEDAHIFCKTCIKRHAEVRIGDGLATFPCLDDACKSEFSMATLKDLLHPTIYKKTEQQRCVSSVKLAQIEDLESCPFCEYLLIIPPEIKVFDCGNPECMKKSCRHCKEPDHTPFRCDQVEKKGETKMRTKIEDKMTKALVRTCNKCNKAFIKTSGCNKMVCQCGAIMCYICRKTIKDYSHFNGPEGSDYAKCSLFTNDEEMNVKDVKEAGEKAKMEVLARNAGLQLKHDPTKL